MFKAEEERLKQIYDNINKDKDADTIIKIFITLIKNVLSNPDEPKFRKVKEKNPQLQQYVYGRTHTMDLLNFLDFKKTDMLEAEPGYKMYRINETKLSKIMKNLEELHKTRSNGSDQNLKFDKDNKIFTNYKESNKPEEVNERGRYVPGKGFFQNQNNNLMNDKNFSNKMKNVETEMNHLNIKDDLDKRKQQSNEPIKVDKSQIKENSDKTSAKNDQNVPKQEPKSNVDVTRQNTTLSKPDEKFLTSKPQINQQLNDRNKQISNSAQNQNPIELLKQTADFRKQLIPKESIGYSNQPRDLSSLKIGNMTKMSVVPSDYIVPNTKSASEIGKLDTPSEGVGKMALQLTNEYRARNGLSSLKWENEIWQICYGHSKNMGDKLVRFSHDGFEERVGKYKGGYSKACENVFYCAGMSENNVAEVEKHKSRLLYLGGLTQKDTEETY